MWKITIGIPTYQRPAMLEKLLNSIFVGQFDPSLLGRVDIVVVDNDAEKTAEATVKRLMQLAPASFRLHYFDYPVKGLANVRNEIINRSLFLNPDYILFVDDDQYVAPEWLNEIVSTIVNNNCDFVLGPVIPDFEEKVSPEVSQWFKYYTFDDQIALDFIDSGNLIMRARFLQEQDLRFDTRFNTTGAEDSYFGVNALKMGASIFWAKKAITYENIPAKRATLQWLIKRRFRGANTYTYIILLERRYELILKKILVNFAYFLIGLAGLVLLPLKHYKYRYFGVLKLAESFGGFAGLMNIKFHEYLKNR